MSTNSLLYLPLPSSCASQVEAASLLFAVLEQSCTDCRKLVIVYRCLGCYDLQVDQIMWTIRLGGSEPMQFLRNLKFDGHERQGVWHGQSNSREHFSHVVGNRAEIGDVSIANLVISNFQRNSTPRLPLVKKFQIKWLHNIEGTVPKAAQHTS